MKQQWIQVMDQGVILRIQVHAHASKNEVIGIIGIPERLKIRIKAPPTEGRANEELVRFFKKIFRVRGLRVLIIRGTNSPYKDIMCFGIRIEEVKKSLGIY